ncbi:MAG: AMP-dependent synthetase/ligase [Gemmatimonadota bacterium]
MNTPTILHSFRDRARRQADERAFAVFGDDVHAHTWRQWDRAARSFACALIEEGCVRGETVAVLAGNNEVWPIADLGALMAGAVSVGVYPTSAAVQVHQVLNDCGARVVVVDTEAQLAKVLAVRSGLPRLRTILCAADTSWREWLVRGAALLARHGAEVEARIDNATPDDIAILIYTSGSTGIPKGARISHRYVTASVDSIRTTLDLTPRDSALSFLPLCHASERVFGLYTRIRTGMPALLVPDAASIWDAARSFEPTVFGGLPRFFEKIHEALLDGHSVPSMIGSRVRIATSGGATLAPAVAEHLAAHGLTVLGAYGLTEHLCAVMQRPASYSFDSAGLPMPGTTLAICDDAEILIRRSGLTFSGYHNHPGATRAAFTADGEWLRTGDLGFIDEAGRLHVTGRKKELIALSGGKKIAPVPIERRLAESSWISQAVLFGENRQYISALLVPRRRQVESWAAEQSLALRYDALLEQPGLLERIQSEVDAVNSDLSRPEQIKRFALLPDELSIERDELTPTLKIRRAVIEQRYRTQLEFLYT